MASTFPATLDSFPTSHQDDAQEIIHAATINDNSDAINKIEAELGPNPSGSDATVVARLGKMAFANANTGDVTANAADTYLAGSALSVAGRLQIGTTIKWSFSMTKTAAGVATPIYTVRVGGNGSIADTARHTFTGLAQTAATDTGWHEITLTVRNVGASSIVTGVMRMEHTGTTTGLANAAQIQILQSQPAGFDLTGGPLWFGISCNPGTAGVWTFQQIAGQVINPNAL